MKKFKTVVTSIGVSVILFLIYNLYQPVFYSFGFTDEGDNISIGQYILMGKKPYQDIYSQHQPLTYYISAGIQTITRPDNVLLVIRRHRQFVVGFSFIWIVFLSIRFGLGMVPFVVLLEVMKYYFLGHLFLAESLVIYPLIYVISVWWGNFFDKKLNRRDAFLTSLCCFFIIFNLLPMIPIVLIVITTLYYRNRNEAFTLHLLLAPFCILTLGLFIFVPFFSYVESTLWANAVYYIPRSTKVAFNIEESKSAVLLKAFLYPFLTFFAPKNVLIILYRILSVAFLSSLVAFVVSKKRLMLAGGLLFILTVSNLRPGFGTHIFYHAFHSLPFFSLFVISIFLLLKKGNRFAFQLISATVLIFVFCYIGFSKNSYFHENLNQENVAYINFAEVFTYSRAIKTLSDSKDTLMVVPHEELLYWYPQLLPPTRFLFYEAWVHDVPAFKKEIETGLHTNPPTFVYWSEDTLEPFLDTKAYVSVPKDTATYSALHIAKTKLPSINNQQWTDLAVYGFKKVELY